MRHVAFLIALLLAGVSATAWGGTVPLDRDGFTDFVASAFQRALPDADVVVARPLTLEITLPNDPGGAHKTHLDALYNLCRREPDRCDRAVVVHLHDMTTS